MEKAESFEQGDTLFTINKSNHQEIIDLGKIPCVLFISGDFFSTISKDFIILVESLIHFLFNQEKYGILYAIISPISIFLEKSSMQDVIRQIKYESNYKLEIIDELLTSYGKKVNKKLDEKQMIEDPEPVDTKYLNAIKQTLISETKKIEAKVIPELIVLSDDYRFVNTCIYEEPEFKILYFKEPEDELKIEKEYKNLLLENLDQFYENISKIDQNLMLELKYLRERLEASTNSRDFQTHIPFKLKSLSYYYSNSKYQLIFLINYYFMDF